MTAFGFTLLSFLLCAVLMILAWMVALRLRFFSLVDVAWTYGVGILAAIYGFAGGAPWQRRLVVSTMGLVWSLRLGTHLLVRLKADYPREDRRYVRLLNEWGSRSDFRFLRFFLMQGLTQPLFALPFALAAQDLQDPWHLSEILGLSVFLIGFLGETTADAQLRSFKLNSANRGKVCDIGLWRYSRHPNYFFEWVIWCGIALVAFEAPYGYLGLLCPVLMFYVLVFVTGIPPAERQSLASRGDAYRVYQRKTSAFVPWPPAG